MINLSWDIRPNRKRLIGGNPELHIGDRIRVIECEVYDENDNLMRDFTGVVGTVVGIFKSPGQDPTAFVIKPDHGDGNFILENWEGVCEDYPIDRWELLS